MIKIKKWGLTIGEFRICWYDLWDKKFAFEISYKYKRII